MSSSVSLPPDQSLRISRLNANLIVLSVAEDGIKLGKGTSLEDIAKSRSYTGGAHYFAETAVVSSNGSSPSGLTLAAWELICPKIATLDTNGPDGAENGDSTRRNGKEGGSLALYVQDLDDASAKNLSLETYGGTGGNATEQTATAGDGGKGGKMFTILQPTYVNLLTKATGYFKRAEFHPSDEEKEKQYKVLVRKKDLLYSLAQDLVSNGNSLNASTETVKAIFQTLSQELAKDDKDRTVLSVKLATAKALRKLKNLIQDQRTEMTPQVDDVRGGYSGVGINVDVDPGKKGEDGMNSQIFLSTWDPAILVHATVPFVHPDQCRMLLERANFFFYLNSPKTRNRARDIYQRIMNRLAFLQFLKTDHPLYKAYETYTTKKIMPRGSIESLRTSLNAAKNQLLHLNQGKVVSKA